MTNPDHTTIVTQWVRAGDLPEMRKGTSTPLDDPIWVSVGDEHPDSNGVRTTTCHLLVNFTGYEDDDGRHIRLEFPDGIPWRRVALDEEIEVHRINPGRDLIEGVDPRPPPPRTRGAR